MKLATLDCLLLATHALNTLSYGLIGLGWLHLSLITRVVSPFGLGMIVGFSATAMSFHAVRLAYYLGHPEPPGGPESETPGA